MGNRPQRYIYPFKKVEMNRSLQVIKDIDFFTTDGKKMYSKGEILENSDINTFGVVDSNNEYFFDKENVYYKTKILPVKNSGNLEIVSIDQGHNFLYDKKNGYVFLEDYSFDMEKAPYRVLGNKGNHTYDLLFVNNEGVYFYDNQAKKQKRAGDNIFAGKIEEVNPNVFTDDKNIYYLQSYDVKRKKKNKGSYADILVSKNIGVFYLGEKKNWEKIKDIGILKSIGYTNKNIRRIFTIEGLIIGVFGMIMASGLSPLVLIGLKILFKEYMKGGTYYLEELPLYISQKELLIIYGVTFVVVFLSTIFPAARAARLKPVEALKYE